MQISGANIQVGGTTSMTINGMKIKIQKGRVFINGVEWGPLGAGESSIDQPDLSPKTLALTEDSIVDGDIYGDVYIESKVFGTVNLTVKGNIEGSVQTNGAPEGARLGGGGGKHTQETFSEAEGLLNAMEYLHGKSFSPRDMHTGNVMMRPDSGQLVMVDVGLFRQ